MNNDEILRMAQENPVAEVEEEITRKSVNWAMGMGVLIFYNNDCC